jgi:hypothetical protein
MVQSVAYVRKAIRYDVLTVECCDEQVDQSDLVECMCLC